MNNGQERKVKQIELTAEQLKAGAKRATQNSKNWVAWKDPKATDSHKKD